jgi:hypothetical protein
LVRRLCSFNGRLQSGLLILLQTPVVNDGANPFQQHQVRFLHISLQLHHSGGQQFHCICLLFQAYQLLDLPLDDL